jgi:hypothetical protein
MARLLINWILVINLSAVSTHSFAERPGTQHSTPITTSYLEVTEANRTKDMLNHLQELARVPAAPRSTDSLIEQTIANRIHQTPRAQEITATMLGWQLYEKRYPNATPEEREIFQDAWEIHVHNVSQATKAKENFWNNLKIGPGLDVAFGEGGSKPKLKLKGGVTIDAVGIARDAYNIFHASMSEEIMDRKLGILGMSHHKPASVGATRELVSVSLRTNTKRFNALALSHGLPLAEPGMTAEEFFRMNVSDPKDLILYKSNIETARSLTALSGHFGQINDRIKDTLDTVKRIDEKLQESARTDAHQRTIKERELEITQAYRTPQFILSVLGHFAQDQGRDAQVAVATASYLVEASKLVNLHNANQLFMLQHKLPKLEGFDPSQLKFDLLNLAGSLFSTIFSLFGSGKSPYQTILEEIQSLRTDLQNFEGAALSRLDGISGSLAHIGSQTRISLARVERKLDHLIHQQRAASTRYNQDRLEDQKKKSGELKDARLISANHTRDKLRPALDRFKLGESQGWDLKAYDGVVRECSRTQELNSLGLHDTDDYSICPAPEFLLDNALELAAGFEPIPGRDGETVHSTTFSTQFDKSLSIHFREHDERPIWHSYAETIAASRLKTEKQLGDGWTPHGARSEINQLKDYTHLVAPPELLAKKIAAVSLGIHEYQQAFHGPDRPTHETPKACFDLATSIVDGLKGLKAQQQILPMDLNKRPDVAPVMVLAGEYLRHLHSLQNLLFKKKKSVPLAISPTELREWAKTKLPGWLSSGGIAACANQEFASQDFNSSAQYPNFNLSVFSQLDRENYPITRIVEQIPLEVLYTYYISEGDFKLCYEWTRKVADVRYGKGGNGSLNIHTEAYAGIKIKYLLRPKDGFLEQSLPNGASAFGREAPPNFNDGGDYLVLSERTALSPYRLKDWAKDYDSHPVVYQSKATPPDGGAPVFVGTPPNGPWHKHVEAQVVLGQIPSRTGLFGPEFPTGWNKADNDTEIRKQQAGQFFALSNPNLANAEHKAWVSDLASTLFDDSKTHSLLEYVQEGSKLSDNQQYLFEQRASIPLLSFPDNEVERKKQLAASVWNLGKRAADDYFTTAQQDYSDPESEIGSVIQALEGSRQILNRTLTMSYGGELPDDIGGALARLASQKDIATLHHELGNSFFTVGSDRLGDSEPALRTLLLAISDPKRNRQVSADNELEKKIKNGLGYLRELLGSQDPAIKKSCDPARLKTLLAEISELEAEVLKNSNAGNAPRRLLPHSLYETRREQAAFANAVHDGIAGGIGLDVLLGEALNTVKNELRKNSAPGLKGSYLNVSPAATILREELNRKWQSQSPPASSLLDKIRSVFASSRNAAPVLETSRDGLAQKKDHLEKQLTELVKHRWTKYPDKVKEHLNAIGLKPDLNFTGKLTLLSEPQLKALEDKLYTWYKIQSDEHLVSAPDSLSLLQNYLEDPQKFEMIHREVDSHIAHLLLEDLANAEARKDGDKQGKETQYSLMSFGIDRNFSSFVTSEVDELVELIRAPDSDRSKIILKGLKENSVLRTRTRELLSHLTKQKLIQPEAILKRQIQQKIEEASPRSPSQQLSEATLDLLRAVSKLGPDVSTALHGHLLGTVHSNLAREVAFLEKLVQLERRYHAAVGHNNDEPLVNLTVPTNLTAAQVAYLEDQVRRVEQASSRNVSWLFDRWRGASVDTKARSILEHRFSPKTLQGALQKEAEFYGSSHTPYGFLAGLAQDELLAIEQNLDDKSPEQLKCLAEAGVLVNFANDRPMDQMPSAVANREWLLALKKASLECTAARQRHNAITKIDTAWTEWESARQKFANYFAEIQQMKQSLYKFPDSVPERLVLDELESRMKFLGAHVDKQLSELGQRKKIDTANETANLIQFIESGNIEPRFQVGSVSYFFPSPNPSSMDKRTKELAGTSASDMVKQWDAIVEIGKGQVERAQARFALMPIRIVEAFLRRNP